MPRNAQPTELILARGRSHHLTKAEIQRRKSAEIKVKSHTFKASEEVMADQRALQEFKRLKKLYKEIEFVGSLDEHLINQYCMSVSELDDLVFELSRCRANLREIDEFDEGPAEKRKEAMGSVLVLGTEIRMKRQEIVRLGDRLYLNPVSRTKNVPKKQEEKPPSTAQRMFGDV